MYDVRIFWNGETVKKKMQNVCFKTVYEAGVACLNQAVMLCPVADYMGGRLRASLTMKTNKQTKYGRGGAPKESGDDIQPPGEENVAHIGTAVSYSFFQEFGTLRMAAQPYLRPAFDYIKGETLRIAMRNGKYELVDYLGIKGVTTFQQNVEAGLGE